MTFEERFWSKVDRRGDDECWPWTACVDRDGYGRFSIARSSMAYAHRVAYELAVGPIPDGLVIDHVRERGCTLRSCCNPAHLEPVTHRENYLRGNSPPRRNARKSRCPRGHEYRHNKRGDRYCPTCNRDRMRRVRSVPQHARGSADEGVVRHDYLVEEA